MINETQKFKIHEMVNHFGKDIQMPICIEELSELIKELTKDMRGKGKIENIIEEMGDVSIILENIKYIYDISDEDISKSVDKKLERTMNIMKENKTKGECL